MIILPNAKEFFETTTERAIAMLRFAHAAQGKTFDEDEGLIIMGIAAGITCAVEEMAARNLLKEI